MKVIRHTVETYQTLKIHSSIARNQMFLTASVTAETSDALKAVEDAYSRIAAILADSSSSVVHERCFAGIVLRPKILAIREQAFRTRGIEPDTPVTFIEGNSCLGISFSGVQIRALHPVPDTRIRTIMDRGEPRGRAWNLNGSTFYMLQSIDGGTDQATDRTGRTGAMFRQAESILKAQGATYRDVVRTWIYIPDILDWYDEFNAVRNKYYAEYGFVGNGTTQAEQIYLPASTGIEGRNPRELSAVMDVFAIHSETGSSIRIRPVCGTKQRSPYRYGSAFSRAMVVEEPHGKLIFVSGTASIDEHGKSIHLGDAEAQIRQTLSVVSALVAPEGATLQDLCEATVFLKRREDLPVYQKVAAEMKLTDVPSVNVEADVCRDELLFELDAAFILGTPPA